MESPAGDPSTASLSKRTSFGLFWEERADDGIPVLITTTTIDHDEEIVGQNGYCCYPKSVIRKLLVVKRGRKVKLKENGTPGAS